MKYLFKLLFLSLFNRDAYTTLKKISQFSQTLMVLRQRGVVKGAVKAVYTDSTKGIPTETLDTICKAIIDKAYRYPIYNDSRDKRKAVLEFHRSIVKSYLDNI